MKQSILCVIVMLGLVILCVMSAGCMDSIPKNFIQKQPRAVPEPESGIAAWIVAVNDRDYGAVYDLLPSSKRAGITQEQFIQSNKENPSPFITSGLVITDFWIMEKKVDGLNATITAGFETSRGSSGGNDSPASPTVFFTFNEIYEENGWKVWTP
jgi:hypothetical protein